jgi:hypothetical protein
MELLVDKNRVYKRYRPSADEKIKLKNNGLQWVLSSNVSAVGTIGNDLVIRFINGSLYQYPNQAKLFEPMLKSNSKGHYVWVKLRKPQVAFNKIGSLPLDTDTDVTDDELLKLVDDRGKATEQKLLDMGMFIPTTGNELGLIGLQTLLGI